MIRSPLRYPGGKSKVADQIVALIPEFGEYREPFVGGGSVFIYLEQIYPDRKFWINDLYFELYNFWLTCQNDLDGVVHQVEKWHKGHRDGKKLHRWLIDNLPIFTPLEKASAFFALNRMTFSGTTESGGYSEQGFQKRFTTSSIDRLRKLDKVLGDIKITHLDYQEVVEADGDDVFIFLDPPYFSAMKSALYGKNGKLHKSFDHERFAKVMRKCKHKWLITYDDSEYVRDLFSFAYIKPWDIMYGMRNITKESEQSEQELFIANYPLVLPKERQLALFEKRAHYKTR
ncbi:MAG: DNA adenine methylase [Chloroflexi bacterium]|nr:DNA adenine methylase [Chloroflexota bacterium]